MIKRVPWTDAELHKFRLTFTPGEVGEFGRAIDAAPAADITRHAGRLAAAQRLGAVTDATYHDLAKRLEARRAQLGAEVDADRVAAAVLRRAP